jgi:uncharacterized protein involved in exopolysaccharide biosynthesis
VNKCSILIVFARRSLSLWLGREKFLLDEDRHKAEKVTSSSVVQRVADALRDKNLSFFDDEPAGLVTKWKQRLLGISPKPGIAARARLKQAIVEDKSIVVAADRRSELIHITMHTTKPEEAKQIVDAFITTYNGYRSF